MEFNSITDKVKLLKFENLRADRDNYFEAVIIQEELPKLTNRLIEFFGEPVWPSKDKLPLQAQGAIGEFGGITNGQTLYFKNEGNMVMLAMIWPWQDGLHITVKIAKK